MSGFITFWSKDYVKRLNKAKDTGPFRVVYGSRHTKMPSILSVRKGDVVYPAALLQGTLCVMARLKVERIEPAFDYLMRETGLPHSALIPEGIMLVKQGPFGEFASFTDGSGYMDKIQLPDNIHTIIDLDKLTAIEHQFHQEPITCCAKHAASGSGTDIFPRPIPLESISTLCFGNTPAKQKPLRLDKNGIPTSVSLSGFVRKMSDETFKFFEKMFE